MATSTIHNSLRFGERWSPGFKKLAEEVTYTEAEEYHRTKRPYTVLLSTDGKPTHAIVINQRTKVFAITFLDPLQRRYLLYDFREVEEGKLFLNEVDFWEFKGDSDDVTKAEFTKFSPNGQVRVEKVDAVTRKKDVAEFVADLTQNWEPVPKFGEYDVFVRKER